MSLIGKNIKYARRKKGLSQEMLAKESGLNRGNIASYEGGKVLPSAKNLLTIATLLDVEIADMIHKDLDEASVLVDLEESTQAEIEAFIEFSKALPSIIEGQRAYHKVQVNRYDDIPHDFRFLIHEYERVLNVLDNAKTHCEKMANQLQKTQS